MKILIVASWYPEPGQLTGSFFRDRARLLAQHGCEVSVVTADLRLRTGGAPPGITVRKDGGVTEYRCFKRNLTPFWEGGVARQKVPMIRKLYEQVCRDSGKPDLIHLESARSARAAVALARSEHIPLTYTEHYSDVLSSSPGSYYDRVMRLAVSSASHIFLISSAMRRKLDPPDGKWSMLPNEVDFSAFTLSESSPPPERFTFKALGSLRKVKGYDLLLKAFASVHAAYPACRLVIGGGGEEEAALKSLCDRLSLSDCVEFPGPVPLEERGAFFRDASAFVCSSHTETFSVVTVEAFACGVPVVATKCGGPEDLVNESNGYLVEKDSVSALASGLTRMVENRKRFCGPEIRAQAAALYDREVIVKKQMDCFASVISGYRQST